MSRLWIVPLIWLLNSCATEAPLSPATIDAGLEITWPAAPEPVRIRYLYSFDEPKDLGYKLPLSNRLQDFLGGSATHNMVRPYAIAVNRQMIAVADPGAGSVHLFNSRRKTYQALVAAGKKPLLSPIGIALGKDRIYIADSVLNKVFVLDSQQRLVATLRDFERPTALAYDHENQRLYVTDTRGHKILAFDHQGKKVLSIGERGHSNGQFNYPSHITIANGRLYVNDTMNFRIQVFDLAGNHLRTFGAHGDSPGYIAQPKGLAVNSDGHIFIAEAVANRVQIFNLDGEFLLSFGFTGQQPAAFQMPTGIAIADDRIYITDSGNRRVQVFEYHGED